MTADTTSAVTAAPTQRLRPPALTIHDDTLEALKWLALILMTVDHVDKYLCRETVPQLFDMGRLAMPLFATVFGLNMARPSPAGSARYGRTLRRLLAAWLVSTPTCLLLGGLAWGWYPLDVMAMFACTTCVMWLTERQTRLAFVGACLVFVVGGTLVEYWWPGLILCLAAWRYAKRPSWLAMLMWLAAAASLYVINRHCWWALAAIPVLLLATRVELTVPRSRLLFYVYYPAHLWVIAAILQLDR